MGKDEKYIEEVKLEDVLNHPRWKMGKKTTIDSANLVNKALEIVEAHYLFDFPYEKNWCSYSSPKYYSWNY